MNIIATPASGRPRRTAHIGWMIAASCLAVAATVVVPAGQASAAVCDSDGCAGMDPNQAGCAADAITPKGAPPVVSHGVTLELRYSPSCHAKWARITPARLGWHFTVHNENGAHQDERDLAGNYDHYYTNMVNGNNVKAWACFDDGVCTLHA
jgi:Protein of unknown function (DUF2690)